MELGLEMTLASLYDRVVRNPKDSHIRLGEALFKQIRKFVKLR